MENYIPDCPIAQSLDRQNSPTRSPSTSTVPPGRQGHFQASEIAKIRLWSFAFNNAAGGNLTANAYGGDGTLFDAIKMLSPHLPDGFNLSALSLITFQRLKTRCARLAGKQT